MFCGTMRENLDPFGRSDDVTIWSALEAARLSQYVSGLEGKLDAEASRKISNWSVFDFFCDVHISSTICKVKKAKKAFIHFLFLGYIFAFMFFLERLRRVSQRRRAAEKENY